MVFDLNSITLKLVHVFVNIVYFEEFWHEAVDQYDTITRKRSMSLFTITINRKLNSVSETMQN